MTVLTKRPYDRRNFSVDVSPAMRQGDVIGSVESVTENGSSDLIIDGIAHTANLIAFRVSGGFPGKSGGYEILLRFEVESNPSQRLEAKVNLHVLE